MKQITTNETTSLNFFNETVSPTWYNQSVSLNFNIRDYDGTLIIFKIVLDFLDVITWGDIF